MSAGSLVPRGSPEQILFRPVSLRVRLVIVDLVLMSSGKGSRIHDEGFLNCAVLSPTPPQPLRLHLAATSFSCHQPTSHFGHLHQQA